MTAPKGSRVDVCKQSSFFFKDSGVHDSEWRNERVVSIEGSNKRVVTSFLTAYSSHLSQTLRTTPSLKKN